MSALLLLTFVAGTTVFTVNTTSTAADDGSCASGICTLVEALDLAGSTLTFDDVLVRIQPGELGPLVIVAPTFVLNSTGNRNLEIDATGAAGFDVSSPVPVVELRAADSNSGFALSLSTQGTVTLRGLVLTGAPLQVSSTKSATVVDTRLGVGLDGQPRTAFPFVRTGMALSVVGVTLQRVRVSGAGLAGIDVLGAAFSVVVVEDTIVSGSGGAGFHVATDAPLTLTRCIFSNNGSDGAELLVGSGAPADVVITDSNFSGNAARGLVLTGRVATITGSTFLHNDVGLASDSGLEITDSGFGVAIDGSFVDGNKHEGLLVLAAPALPGAQPSTNAIVSLLRTRVGSNGVDGAAGVRVSGGLELQLDNSHVDGNFGDGVNAAGSDVDFENSSVDDNVGKGLSATAGTASILSTTFDDNAEGVRFDGTRLAVIGGLTANDNDNGGVVGFDVDVQVGFSLSNLTANDNGADGIFLTGSVADGFGQIVGFPQTPGDPRTDLGFLGPQTPLGFSASGNGGAGIALSLSGSVSIQGVANDNGTDGLNVEAINDATIAISQFQASNNHGGDGVVVHGAGNAQLNSVSARGNARNGVNIEITPPFVSGLTNATIVSNLDLGEEDGEILGNFEAGFRCGQFAVIDASETRPAGGPIGIDVAGDCQLLALSDSPIGLDGAFDNPGIGLLVEDRGSASVGEQAFVDANNGRDSGGQLPSFFAFQQGGAIVVLDSGRIRLGDVQMLGNSGPAVDIHGDGRTFNDPNDADGVLNYPYIESVEREGSFIVVHGMVAAGAIVNFFLADRDSGDGQPLHLVGSAIEGFPFFDEDEGTGTYDDPAWGADADVARFSFRFVFGPTGVVAIEESRLMVMATDGDRSSEMSPVFLTDPCLPSTSGAFCDADGDGVVNGDELTRLTNPLQADTDGDRRSDGAEGLLDGNDDGVLDALDPCAPDNTAAACAVALANECADLTAPSCDRDRDGLTNAQERVLLTNELLADSDADGVSDGDEATDANGNGTLDALESSTADRDRDGLVAAADVDDGDACLPDPQAGRCDRDEDGLINNDELRFGTDPENADSDGDGLADGGEARLDSDRDGINNANESNVEDIDHDGVVDALDLQLLPDDCRGKNVQRGGSTILTAENIAALAGAVCVVGDLRILGPVGPVTLPDLRVVTGRIILVDTDVTSLQLPGLVHAGQIIVQDNATLTAVSFPALTAVDGDLVLTDNPALTSVDLAQLITVGGSLRITNNNVLIVLTAPNLVEVGRDLEISDNDALESVLFEQVIRVGENLIIRDNDALVELLLSVVAAVGGNLVIVGNGSLESVDLASLENVGGDLNIEENAALDDVDLGALTSVGGDLTVTDLPEEAEVDLDDLDKVGGVIDSTLEDALPTGFACGAEGCAAVCGDGTVINGEQCDDGNGDDGDGCSGCLIDLGFLCGGAPSQCATLEDIAVDDPPDTTTPETCAQTSTSSSVLGLGLLLLLRGRRRTEQVARD